MTFLVRNFVFPDCRLVIDFPSLTVKTKARQRKSILSLRSSADRAAHYRNEHVNRYKSIEPHPISFCLIFFSATVAIVSFALYIGYPVSEIKYAYYNCHSDRPFFSFPERYLLRVPVRLLITSPYLPSY